MDGGDREDGGIGATVCVTGSTGYIGSWLVRSLLRKGYTVHATARDPDLVTGKKIGIGLASDRPYRLPAKVALALVSIIEDKEQNKANIQEVQIWHERKAKLFLQSWGVDNSRLKIFQSDLNGSGSFDEAVRGCIGVFHVAASMDFHASSEDDDIESHVRSNVLDPAIYGTLNLLQACQRAGSVRRVVLTSSISTITAKDEDGSWKPVVDESSTIPTKLIWKTKPSGWVYVLSKLMTDEAAFQYAEENGINLVSVIPTTVAGSFLTPNVPTSVRVLLSPITGDPELYPILRVVHARLGSINIVHIDDVCRAHIFLLEQASAAGRYICSASSYVMPQLAERLSMEYPPFSPSRFSRDFHNSIPSCISSKKLTDLGFEFKHEGEDIIKESVASSIQGGLLKMSVAHEGHN